MAPRRRSLSSRQLSLADLNAATASSSPLLSDGDQHDASYAHSRAYSMPASAHGGYTHDAPYDADAHAKEALLHGKHEQQSAGARGHARQPSTFLESVLPAPSQPRAKRRLLATAVLALLLLPLSWYVLSSTWSSSSGNNNREATANILSPADADALEAAEKWVTMDSAIPWGFESSSATRSTITAKASATALAPAKGNTTILASGESGTTNSTLKLLRQASNETNALLASGALSKYVWHETLPEAQDPYKGWNATGEGRLIVVGDLHGQHLALRSLLASVSFDPERDTLLHTGDVVGSAPIDDALELLRLLRRLGAKGVRGTNDQLAIEWRSWIEAIEAASAQRGISLARLALDDEPEEEQHLSSSAAPAPSAATLSALHSKLEKLRNHQSGNLGGAAAAPHKGRPARLASYEEIEALEAEARRLHKRWWPFGSSATSNDNDSEADDHDEVVDVEEEEEEQESGVDEGDSGESYENDEDSLFDNSAVDSLAPSSASRVSSVSATQSVARYAAPSRIAAGKPLASSGAVLASNSDEDDWLDLEDDELAEHGIELPNGWSTRSSAFKLAKAMSTEDVEHLSNLPLTLSVPELQTYVVHAGMLPWKDPIDALHSASGLGVAHRKIPSVLTSTSNTTFAPPPSIFSLLGTPERSLLIQTPNVDPFTLLNVRQVEVRKQSAKGAKEEWKPLNSGTPGRLRSSWVDLWERNMQRVHEICGDDEELDGKGACRGVNVIYGHWARAGVEARNHTIGIDTGCVYGRSLTALVVGGTRERLSAGTHRKTSAAVSTGKNGFAKKPSKQRPSYDSNAHKTDEKMAKAAQQAHRHPSVWAEDDERADRSHRRSKRMVDVRSWWSKSKPEDDEDETEEIAEEDEPVSTASGVPVRVPVEQPPEDGDYDPARPFSPIGAESDEDDAARLVAAAASAPKSVQVKALELDGQPAWAVSVPCAAAS